MSPGGLEQMGQGVHRVKVNRAAVLTLWAAVVAEYLGFDEDEALSVGRAVTYLETYAQGAATQGVPFGLGELRPGRAVEHYNRTAEASGRRIDVLARAVPILRDELATEARHGLFDSARVRAYLDDRFGNALSDTLCAMRELAESLSPKQLRASAYYLYESFRPDVPPGRTGWGALGVLDLGAIRALADVDLCDPGH